MAKKEIISGDSKANPGKKIILPGFLLTLFFIGIFLYHPLLFSYFENKIYDTMHRSFNDSGSSFPVIVDIDEKSLEAMGQWPWPRYKTAKLFEKIADANPASICLDILFPEPDRTSLNHISQEIEKEFGLDVNLKNIPDEFTDNDVYLARVLARGPFVLGYKFGLSGISKFAESAVPLEVFFQKQSRLDNININLYKARSIVGPIRKFHTVIDRTGFVNMQPDSDGIIRKVPLLMRFENQIYPSLALATFMQTINKNSILIKTSNIGLESLQVSGINIPLDTRGNLLVKYRKKPESIKHISALDIFNDTIDFKKALTGKIVFVGTSASGLKDVYATPLESLFPGVEIHATIVDNILHQDFLQRPEWSIGAELFITVLSGIIIIFALAYMGPVTSFFLLVSYLSMLWMGSLLLMTKSNIFFSPIYPLMTVVGNFVFLGFLRFRIAEKQAIKHKMEIQNIESELNVAKEIQMGVIPKTFPPFPDQDYFDLYADLIPAREVGGDLYDFFFIDEDNLCFTIGDVSGKGVPASLFMVITRTLVKNLAPLFPAPKDMMTQINTILTVDNPKGLFVSLFIAVINLKTGHIRYANGGHNLPVIISKSKEVYYKEGRSGPVVGAMPGVQFEELSFTLKPGDGILLYTDGVTEAMNKKNQEFTETRLLQECQLCKKESAKSLILKILKQVRQHAGTKAQSDDIALMMLKYYRQKI